MVWVYAGSFRGVRDQPVTDHDGSIPAGVRHIRRVFGAFGAAARARSTFVPHRLDEVLRPRHALLREVQRLSQEGASRPGPVDCTSTTRGPPDAPLTASGSTATGVAAVTERGVVGGGRGDEVGVDLVGTLVARAARRGQAQRTAFARAALMVRSLCSSWPGLLIMARACGPASMRSGEVARRGAGTGASSGCAGRGAAVPGQRRLGTDTRSQWDGRPQAGSLRSSTKLELMEH